MKIYIFPIVALLVFAFLSSCDNDSTPEIDVPTEINAVDYSEFQGMSLKKYEIPALIMLPDQTSNIGAAVDPEIIHMEGDIHWEINIGPNYTMKIEDYGRQVTVLEDEKKRLSKIKFYTIEYLVDETDLIVYKRTLNYSEKFKEYEAVGAEHVSYHCFGTAEIDGITYVLRSRDEGFHKPIIETMVKSIKSIEKL
jgi:hypothetical protein